MNREHAAKLSELLKDYSEGETIQRYNGVGYTDMLTSEIDAQLMICFIDDRLRIKPKLTPVDLSVLIKSGIDCEFSDNSSFSVVRIGKLHEINKPMLCYEDANGRFSNCRPRMNHVYYWPGGECPLPAGIKARFHKRDSTIFQQPANNFCVRWDHNLTNGDIIGFEILGLEEGYCWPWNK